MDDVIYPDCPEGPDGEPTLPHQRDRARNGCCPYCGVNLTKARHKNECPIAKALESPQQNEELEDHRSTTEHPSEDDGHENVCDVEIEGNFCTSEPEVVSFSASEDTPSAPYYSPRKRNWHKREIPSWSQDDQALYDAICVHLKFGDNLQQDKKIERASLLYRMALARWRSVYKDADQLIPREISDDTVKKMLQRLKKDGNRVQEFLNDPSRLERLVEAIHFCYFYQDRVEFFDDGSYVFIDEFGEPSGDIDVIYRPYRGDDEAEDDRIMNILKDKGILPPKEYDIVPLMEYAQHVRLQKEEERQKFERESAEDLKAFRGKLAQLTEERALKLEADLRNAPPLDLNAIFSLNRSNALVRPHNHKDDSETE